LGQVFGVPAENVEDDGVVVVNVRSVGRNFALPDGTAPFAEGVEFESQSEIEDTKKLLYYTIQIVSLLRNIIAVDSNHPFR
jgi:hypothetical protein